MKKLITEKTINDLKKNGQSNLYVEDNCLITPSARDAIRNFGINLIYGKEEKINSVDNKPSACCIQSSTECCAKSIETKPKVEANVKTDLVEAEIDRLVDLIMEVLRERGLLEQILNK